VRDKLIRDSLLRGVGLAGMHAGRRTRRADLAALIRSLRPLETGRPDVPAQGFARFSLESQRQRAAEWTQDLVERVDDLRRAREPGRRQPGRRHIRTDDEAGEVGR